MRSHQQFLFIWRQALKIIVIDISTVSGLPTCLVTRMTVFHQRMKYMAFQFLCLVVRVDLNGTLWLFFLFFKLKDLYFQSSHTRVKSTTCRHQSSVDNNFEFQRTAFHLQSTLGATITQARCRLRMPCPILMFPFPHSWKQHSAFQNRLQCCTLKEVFLVTASDHQENRRKLCWPKHHKTIFQGSF